MKKLVTSLLFVTMLTLFLIPLFGVEASLLFGGVSVASIFIPKPTIIMAMNNTNNISARESFRIAKELFYNAFRNMFENGPAGDTKCRNFVNTRKLSQSEIRLEVQLNATSNTFTFGLTANQANSNNVIFNTENRLTMQDSLCCNEYAIQISNPSSQIDTTYELKTYGDFVTFGAADAVLLNSTFFSNGSFRITCNNDVIMPYRGLLNHWYKGQTQQTAALGAASPADMIRGAEDGFITDEPNIVLIGSKGYIPQLILPSALTGLANTFVRAHVIFRGILAQNSTSVS